jgi:Ca2+-binding EF-hand superfamily protein
MIGRWLCFAFAIMPLAWIGPSSAQPAADDSALQARRERLLQKWEARFRAADTNGDGLLSLQECRDAGFPAAITGHFAQIDTDGDGQLSPAELMAVYRERLEQQKARDAAP